MGNVEAVPAWNFQGRSSMELPRPLLFQGRFSSKAASLPKSQKAKEAKVYFFFAPLPLCSLASKLVGLRRSFVG
jgi:hypothetical protein